MREMQANIERVTRLNAHVQRLHLSIEESLNALKPGQTVLARRSYGTQPEQWQPYLREHWWPVTVKAGKAGEPGEMVVDRPSYPAYDPGQPYTLLGPVGKPFAYKRTIRQVLMIAHDTMPSPLLMSTEWLLSNKVNTTLVLTGKATDYPVNELPKELEVIKADDKLQWPNRVMTIGWADQVFVAVGQDDEIGRFKAILELFKELRAEVPKQYLFGVSQIIQPCGVGACQACTISLHGGEYALACLDGPALDLTTLHLP
jgi:NAD(P)H-flavin reductase